MSEEENHAVTTTSTDDPAARPRGMSWRPLFCRETRPFDGLRTTHTDVAIVDYKTKEMVFAQKDVEAPDFWSERARKVVAQKYFIKGGIGGDPDARETSVYAMVAGVAYAISDAGYRQGYFATEVDARAFGDDLAWLLIRQYGAFNSPVWFNVRHWNYGITGAGGNWYWNPVAGRAEETTNAYEHPQCSACFIHPIDDSLVGPGGILDFTKDEARLFKYGSGSGANYSNLREKNARLNVGGTSSGPISFLVAIDKFAGAIKSGGTTRRAAKMVCFDVDHPDVEEFIDLKVVEERKAQALIAAGFSGGMEGEAYTTVGGQNANNSVRVTDEFMQAVEDDRAWNLVSRLDGRVVKTVRARELWRKIAAAAWFCADPGLQYHTTINAWHTTPNAGPIRASNPCSEYMHLDNSSCNLASLRLTRFLKKNGTLDIEAYRNACRVFLTAQDILVDYASYPTRRIAEGSHRFRQLGLGYADLGALLMKMGIGYDSAEGRAIAGALTSLMTAEAYVTSGGLAQFLGSFEGFDADHRNTLHVIGKHRDANTHARESHAGVHPEADRLFFEAHKAWVSASDVCEAFGVRNAQVTLLAPTGTIGFLMDCDTTGVEPVLGHVQYKSLAGGGSLTLVNEAIPDALFRLGYEGPQVDRILAHVKKTGGLTGAPGFDPRHLPIFDTSFPSGSDGRFLTPMAHIDMMAAVQPFLSGAISKTINLPKTATVEEIEDLHFQAWKKGLKAVALYRDGCKEAQPVQTKQGAEKAAEPKPEPAKPKAEPAFKHGQRKLPKRRRGTTDALKLDGHKLFIRTGEYDDGTLGEVFVDIAKEGSTLGGLLGMWAKAISIGLQYGVPLSEFIETFTHTKFEPNGIVENHPTIKLATSLVDLVMRVVGVDYAGRVDLQHVQENMLESNEIPPTVTAPSVPPAVPAAGPRPDGPACPSCGMITLRNGSCHRCPNCGTSLGCS